MTTPTPSPFDSLINAINNLGEYQKSTSQDISSLVTAVHEETEAVKAEADARERKVDALQDTMRALRRTNGVLIVAIILLLAFAGFNAYGISQARQTAKASQSTNALLLSCLQPHTTCSDANIKSQTAILDQIRQTQFVIAVCQRQNPLPPKATTAQINSSTSKLILCVQQYYPTFQLPAKVK